MNRSHPQRIRKRRRHIPSTAIQSNSTGAMPGVGLARASNLAPAVIVLLVSSAEAAKPQKDQPPQFAARKSTYIIDVTGERVRIVGPRFYPNPARGLIFPGREAGPQHQPKP